MHHQSVLLNEWLEILKERTCPLYVDGTLGAGGHAEAVLQSHSEVEKFIGIDQDPTALDLSKEKLSQWENICCFIRGNFSDLDRHLGDSMADAIFLDIGVSSMQLDQGERGFSFMKDGPLDMRMDPEGDLTAAEVVNTYSEEDLGRIFREYGEEKRWRRAAAAIVKSRPYQTTQDLVKALKDVLKPLRGKNIHPMTLVFQALRIEVNRELRVLEEVIPKALSCLQKGGVLGIITFHSLEDRIVKKAFQQAASDKENTSGIGGVFIDKEPEVNLITRKPLIANEVEVRDNPRARSAKLRVVEKR